MLYNLGAMDRVCTCDRCRVPTSSGNQGKPEKSRKKFHAWKNQGILKNLNNHGNIMEFCERI